MRINKFLAECGVASRRACDKLIEDGKVKVNGRIASLGQEIDENNDSVVCEGKKVARAKKFEYYVMNKPKVAFVPLKTIKAERPLWTIFLKTRREFSP